VSVLCTSVVRGAGTYEPGANFPVRFQLLLPDRGDRFRALSGRKLPTLLVALALLVAVAAGTYILGRHSIDEKKIRAVGYARGIRFGRSQGHIEGYAEAQREQAKNDRATARAFESRINRESGRAFTAGWNAVFDGFGSWLPGAQYILQVEPGADGAKYEFKTRLLMEAGQAYALCSDGDGICGSP
jgi:hypothetical protein